MVRVLFVEKPFYSKVMTKENLGEIDLKRYILSQRKRQTERKFERDKMRERERERV